MLFVRFSKLIIGGASVFWKGQKKQIHMVIYQRLARRRAARPNKPAGGPPEAEIKQKQDSRLKKGIKIK